MGQDSQQAFGGFFSGFRIDIGSLNDINNVFAPYFGGLLLLAYMLSLVVAYLHIRDEPLVYPMTNPQPGLFFTEYVILVKTSIRPGSSLDPRGRVSIQLKGTFCDTPKLTLSKGKTIDLFLRRGATNIFVYHSDYELGEITEIQFDLVNDFPSETKCVKWRPSYVSITQPITRKHWGSRFNTMISCEDEVSVTAQCLPKRRDRYGIFKALCLFHPWICMFHCPVRLGMYNTFVHVILVFFTIALILCLSLAVYLFKSFGHQSYIDMLAGTACVWLIEILCEGIIRNTVPKFGAARYVLYQGLVEPGKQMYGLNDFLLIYDWDKVRPLVPSSKVVMVYGSEHGSCYSLFPIASPQSIFNLWGLFNKKEEREPIFFLRTLNTCALPLPSTMMWLSIEASGLKEEVLIRQAVSNYTRPFCVFDTWLRDWPLKYPEEPLVAGLIISHIMFKDLVHLIKLDNVKKRGRMAQICVHQWYGMICCLFVYITLQVMEEKGSSVSALDDFIYRNIIRFGKRTPREIKAAWKKRSNYKNENGHFVYSERDANESALKMNSVDGERIRIDRFGSGHINYSSPLAEEVQGLSPSPLHQRIRPMSSPSPYGPSSNLNNNMNNPDQIPQLENYIKMSKAYYETFPLGSANADFLGAKYLKRDGLYLRHKNELNGYCCRNRRCQCFQEIHKKVGKSCLEILIHILTNLRHFMKRSSNNSMGGASLLWERKEMVNNMLEEMRSKAKLYDGAHFQTGNSSSFEDFESLRLFMAVYDNLQDILDGSDHLKYMTEDTQDAKMKEQKKEISKRNESVQGKRCIFCAKRLKLQEKSIDSGCDYMNKMVKFFSKGTIFIAEKEINAQLEAKFSLGHYCATIISQAKNDVQMECTDPPLVMAANVMQATAYTLLTEMLPKSTDFKDMSQEELRGLGSRLQRVKARAAIAAGSKFKQTFEERKRLNKITHLIEEMGARWRMSKRERSFAYTTKLFAKSLIQERIFGLTVYSGFISREHELLLGGNKYWLIEMESAGALAVGRIARKMVSQILKKILEQGIDIDVIFHDISKEMNYYCEQVSVYLYKSEPRYLSTCCYYINNIVEVQIDEYKQILKRMRSTDLLEPSGNVAIAKKGKHFEVNAKKIKLLDGYDHEDIASPLMRWGEIVFSGEPPLPMECRPLREDRRDLDEFIHDYVQGNEGTSMERELVSALIHVRRGIDNLLQAENHVRSKQLQNHLSHVQANLIDQIASTCQTISQRYTLDGDHVREFHCDDLFNVEFFASHKLNLPIVTVVGVTVLFLMVCITLAITALTTITAATLETDRVKDWMELCLEGFVLYAFIFEPIKCFCYGIAGFYVD